MVGGFVAFAVVGQRLVHTRFPRVAEGELNDQAGRFLGVLMAMFGLILAFTIVSLYQATKTAQDGVQNEATLLSIIYRDSRVFDADVISEIDRVLHDYVHEVVETEFELMSEGGFSPRTTELMDELYGVLEGWEPRSHAQQTFYGDAVGKLNEVASARRTRLGDAREELPREFRLLIFTGSFVLVIFLWSFGGPNPLARSLMIAGIALLVGFNLLLVVVLDHPFAGEIAVRPDPFQQGVLATYWP
jgi:hypothetical protein